MLLPGTVLCLALLAGLPGCPGESALNEIASRPGNSGFRNQLLGEERLVSLEQGNLSEDTPNDAAGRIDVLDAFLRKYAMEFGVLPANSGALSLISAAPEQKALFNENEVHQTLIFHQEHLGALVLDAEIYGEFVGHDADGNRLRRVQGRLFDPLTLTTPVPGSSLNVALANRQFLQFLAENGLEGGSVSILPTPVILGDKNFTGFLSLYTVPNDDGTLDRLSVVVNPLTEEIEVNYSIPACRAHDALGDAS